MWEPWPVFKSKGLNLDEFEKKLIEKDKEEKLERKPFTEENYPPSNFRN